MNETNDIVVIAIWGPGPGSADECCQEVRFSGYVSSVPRPPGRPEDGEVVTVQMSVGKARHLIRALTLAVSMADPMGHGA